MMRKQDIVKELVKGIGLLDDKKIAHAFDKQIETKEYFAGLLVKLGYVSNQNVGKTFTSQLGFPPLSVKIETFEKKLISYLPANIALTHRIIPLKQDLGKLTLGTDDPLNFLAQKNLEAIIGSDIELELLRSLDMDKALDSLYASKKVKGLDLGKASEDINVTKGAEDAPIIKLVNLIINEAVKERASDIHVEPLEKKFRVRYRIDGVLHEVPGPPKRLEGSVISRIKIMAGMDIAEKRLPQDGRIKMVSDKKELDLRVSSLPSIHGESIVMRILDKTSFFVGLEDVGFLPKEKKDFEKLINLPNGMILVTGPTGSGKTTTLYSCISEINKVEYKIITAEDPVEYDIEGIIQAAINPKINLTFAKTLRHVLRQDPDVIMVGEIRDSETAEIAIQSALTGHLVFSTLHTNDAPSAVTRLMDMGVEPFLITSTVRAVIAQRLVRTICEKCKEPCQPGKAELEDLGLSDDMAKGMKFYKGKGCSECNNSGYRGRTGLYELFILDDNIKELVVKRTSSSVVRDAARKAGMKTLREYGLGKVLEGATTVEEVLRETKEYA